MAFGDLRAELIGAIVVAMGGFLAASLCLLGDSVVAPSL